MAAPLVGQSGSSVSSSVVSRVELRAAERDDLKADQTADQWGLWACKLAVWWAEKRAVLSADDLAGL